MQQYEKKRNAPQGSYLLSTANATLRYETDDARKADSKISNANAPIRCETGNARVTESAYDVFRLSFFPVCRRISSLAFSGICAKPHIYVKKICRPFHGRNFLKKNPIGD